MAVIKHDGHDFEADVPETDSWKFAKAGADSTLIFSKTKYMMIHYDTVLSEEEFIASFPSADIILLEGFKYSDYPKIEIIRKGNSMMSVCNPKRLMAIATNLDAEERDTLPILEKIPFFELDNAKSIAEFILSDYFH